MWIFGKRCLGATINSPSQHVNGLAVLFWGFVFFICLNLPNHIAWVFCLLWRKKGYSFFWWRASAEDALWIPYSRVNLQSHILKERCEIYFELSWLLGRKNASMMPNPQKGSLMNLVVDLHNVLIIQAFLIPPTPFYLHKNSKSLIGWRWLLHYKNNLKLSIVIQHSWGDWRTLRKIMFLYMPYPHSPFLSYCLPVIMLLEKLGSP